MGLIAIFGERPAIMAALSGIIAVLLYKVRERNGKGR